MLRQTVQFPDGGKKFESLHMVQHLYALKPRPGIVLVDRNSHFLTIRGNFVRPVLCLAVSFNATIFTLRAFYACLTFDAVCTLVGTGGGAGAYTAWHGMG